VGFVDGEQSDVQPLQERQHARLHQALRRQVEHFHFAALDAGRQVALLLGTEGGVQRGGGHAQLFEGRDLIVHQGDQRRHHHGQAIAQQRRHLEAQGLAATGRHQHQGIAAAGHALNDCTLTATETVVAEDVLEDALSLFEHKNSKNHRNIPARLVQKRQHRQIVSARCMSLHISAGTPAGHHKTREYTRALSGTGRR
jgi:hypothetical protein